MAAADATVLYKIVLMARCKQVTATTQLCTTAHTWYITHNDTHNAHAIVRSAQWKELHDSKPGDDCSCCRGTCSAWSMMFLSVTHVRPWSLCTETAPWFRLYPFTSVHAAYSDSWKTKKSLRFSDHFPIIMRAFWGSSLESDSWVHGSLTALTLETGSRRHTAKGSDWSWRQLWQWKGWQSKHID